MEKLSFQAGSSVMDELSFIYGDKASTKAKPVCVQFDRRSMMCWQFLSPAEVQQLRDWCDRVLTIAKTDEKETA